MILAAVPMKEKKEKKISNFKKWLGNAITICSSGWYA
jgi:hypothetical protein